MKYLILAALLAACTKTQPPAPAPKGCKTSWPKAEYQQMAQDALHELGKDLLAAKPSDILSYASAALEYDQACLYTELLAQLAHYESDFNPGTMYQEKDGNWSIGLLQVSVTDDAIYGCSLKSQSGAKDPKENIRCAVRILNRWVPKDGVISSGSTATGWKGGARYWSQFRKPDRLPLIQAAVKAVLQ